MQLNLLSVHTASHGLYRTSLCTCETVNKETVMITCGIIPLQTHLNYLTPILRSLLNLFPWYSYHFWWHLDLFQLESTTHRIPSFRQIYHRGLW